MLNKDVEQYIEMMASEHKRERDKAFDWLLEHSPESRPQLIGLVEAGQYSLCTLGAIYILGQMGKESDVSLLASVLMKGDSRLQWESAQALARHTSPSAFEVLVKALQDNQPEVVGAAAVALGIRSDEGARGSLELLLDHEDESVRYRAVYALRQMGAGQSLARLKEHQKHETSMEVRGLIDEVLKEQ